MYYVDTHDPHIHVVWGIVKSSLWGHFKTIFVYDVKGRGNCWLYYDTIYSVVFEPSFHPLIEYHAYHNTRAERCLNALKPLVLFYVNSYFHHARTKNVNAIPSYYQFSGGNCYTHGLWLAISYFCHDGNMRDLWFDVIMTMLHEIKVVKCPLYNKEIRSTIITCTNISVYLCAMWEWNEQNKQFNHAPSG